MLYFLDALLTPYLFAKAISDCRYLMFCDILFMEKEPSFRVDVGLR